MYPFVSERESLAELLNRAGGIPVTQEDHKRYQAGEVVEHIRIFLYRDGKKHEYRIDPKSSLLWDQKVHKNDAVEVEKDNPLYFGNFSATLKLVRTSNGEQVGGGNAPEPPSHPPTAPPKARATP
jgi:hypothetical protein